jgi:hypothetical protein
MLKHWWEKLPLEFRVLCAQFLLRVVDLEALSIEADVPRFLGQFAGVLIMISCMRALGALWFPPPPAMAGNLEQSALLNTILVVGLISVVTWDAVFPDRRDAMVLAHLPLKARTILLAKVAASSWLVGLAIVALNFASGFSWALVLGGPTGIVRFFAAFWFTTIAASAFLYGALLTVQGLASLLLSRRLFLQFSALGQLGSFALFMAVYFAEPTLDSRELLDPANRWMLASSPVFWFFGLLDQLNGTLPPELNWLAERAWIGCASVVVGASASLWLCYVRTMKQTVEQPDLVPGAGGFHVRPWMSGLRTAILLFSLRSLLRSRQHRVVSAFYASLVAAFALSCLHLRGSDHGTLPADYLISTFMMMTLSVFGLRSVYSLPISLNANWMLRVTQLRPPLQYFAATRAVFLLVGVAPVLLMAMLLAVRFHLWRQAAAHIALLALLGWSFVEVGMLGFAKIPFTCSYLPGKANVQVVFWGGVFIMALLSIGSGLTEQRILHDPQRVFWTLAAVAAAATILWATNRSRAATATLDFEETPPALITTLNLSDGLKLDPKRGDVPQAGT